MIYCEMRWAFASLVSKLFNAGVKKTPIGVIGVREGGNL
jgi:hypothetical protein